MPVSPSPIASHPGSSFTVNDPLPAFILFCRAPCSIIQMLQSRKEDVKHFPQFAGISCALISAEKRSEKKRKNMEQKDYYETLGLTDSADVKQIRDAYRRLALLHHPDRNQNSPEAAEK